jgi:putative FmdB family regulatory protein
MPIYEYECEDCGHTLDALQKLSDAPLRDCPSCGKPALRKRVSAPRFRLKGGGWYETDFKSGNRRNLADGSDSGGDKGDKKGGEKKTGEDKSPAKDAAASTGTSGVKKKESTAAGKSTASSAD